MSGKNEVSREVSRRYDAQAEAWRSAIEEILEGSLGPRSVTSYAELSYAWDPVAIPLASESAAEPALALEAHARLNEAMAYVLLAPGKRLRPILYLATKELLLTGGERVGEAPLATEINAVDRCFLAALEMIHNYSLVHDDLPAMDDDDYRRGRPSCHRAFGEATAILAGDALLNRAHELLLRAVFIAQGLDRDEGLPLDAGVDLRGVTRAAGLVSERAGARGMIGGQIIDLTSEGEALPESPRGAAEAEADSDLRSLRLLQGRKTAALIEASILSAALVYGAPDPVFELLGTYARALGISYQMQDDLLDEEGASSEIGKTARKDREAGKWTEVTLYGAPKAREHLSLLLKQGNDALSGLRELSYAPDFFSALSAKSEKRSK